MSLTNSSLIPSARGHLHYAVDRAHRECRRCSNADSPSVCRAAAPWCVDVCGWSCPVITLRRTRYSNRQLPSSMRVPDQASHTTRLIGRPVRRTHASAEPPEHTFAVMLTDNQRPSCNMTDVPSITEVTIRTMESARCQGGNQTAGREGTLDEFGGLIECGRNEGSLMCESWNHLMEWLAALAHLLQQTLG